MDIPLISIAVDERENRRYDELLKKLGAQVKRQTLSIADFVLSSRLAAERKSREDFEASIIDGRLFEQARRLAETYERAVVVVEGSEGAGRISRAALLGAYSSLVADFGLSLFFTRNEEGTAELLFALARHEQAGKKRQMRVMAKPKALTLSDSQKAVIEVLPGCGPKGAERLLSYFGSPINVLTSDEKKLQEVEGMGPKKAKLIRRVLDSVYECKREGKDPDA